MAQVLLIDDSDHDVELTLSALKQCHPPLSVFRLRDGQQALEYLLRTGAFAARTTNDPELILCDVQMPRLNGLDFVETLRGHRELAYIPIVLMSGSENPLFHEQALTVGAQRFVSKLSKFDDYGARVRSIVHQWLGTDAVADRQGEPPARTNTGSDSVRT